MRNDAESPAKRLCQRCSAAVADIGGDPAGGIAALKQVTRSAHPTVEEIGLESGSLARVGPLQVSRGDVQLVRHQRKAEVAIPQVPVHEAASGADQFCALGSRCRPHFKRA